MSRKSVTGSLLFGVLMACSTQASAEPVTINFSDGEYLSTFDNGVPAQPYDTYSEGGFSLRTPQASGQHLDVAYAHQDSGPILYWHEGPSNTVNNVITLTYTNGTFDFISFELVEIAHSSPTFNAAMTVTGSNGSQIVTSNEELGIINAGWTGLDWVTFDINANSGGVWMDNVVVEQAVAEPSVTALIAIGLLGAGFARRRTQ